MRFVAVNKAVRPAWQDTKAKRLEASYQIARANEGRFTKAFMSMAQGVFDEPRMGHLNAALAAGNAPAAVDAVARFDNSPEATAHWQKIGTQIKEALAKVVAEAGEAAWNKLPRKRVVKADETKLYGHFNIDNPHSIAWVEAHGNEVIGAFAAEARTAIQAAVATGFALGNGTRAMAKAIRASIGLTAREAEAVQRRLGLHLASGMDEAKAAAASERYAQQLLRQRALRIARTETVTAESQGLLNAWAEAKAEGLIIPGTKKTWIEAKGSARTCDVCQILGEEDPIDLDAEWVTEHGSFQRPPAHPSCRCSMGLVVPS